MSIPFSEKMDSFVNIEKAQLERKLFAKEAKIVDVPSKLTRLHQEADSKIKAVAIGDKLAPYLPCADCDALMV